MVSMSVSMSKTLYTFLSPLPLSTNPNNNNSKPKTTTTIPPTSLRCSCSQTRHHPQQQAPHVVEEESDGAGAASPTRGELFLLRQHSIEAAQTVIKQTKPKKKAKDKAKVLRPDPGLASCYGCGAPLQIYEPDAPGYVDPDTYNLKKKHHQLRTVLCGRCRLLTHGHMITAVGGNGGYSGGKQFVSAEELREKLSHLRHEKTLIVKLVDIIDFNGSFLARVRDLVGANPIILVVTKIDLLPKGTDLNCVGDWVVEATTKKRLNVLSVHLTSAKSSVGIAGVVSEIQKEKKGRDVYILGSANVGKSAFISASLRLMAQKDPVAAAARKYKPIESAVPGTTLGPIQIDAFPGGGRLYDTPGVHLHHRQAAVVHVEDLPVLAPQSRLRGQSVKGQLQSSGLNGISIFWGGLVRIDVLKVLPETNLTFYGPKALPIHVIPTPRAEEFYKANVGVMLTPPTSKEKLGEWKGLETERQLHIKFEDLERPACDIAISGLGWISVVPAGNSLGISDELATKELHMSVHVPKPVEIFVRPPLPVGMSGAKWYQYPDLTEEEEELRPKWNF